MIQNEVNTFWTKKYKTTKRAHAFNGSCNVEVLNFFNPELQFKDTESAIKNTELERFKFVTTLILVFGKIETANKTKYNTFYLYSKAETVSNESDIDHVFESIFTTVISNIQ